MQSDPELTDVSQPMSSLGQRPTSGSSQTTATAQQPIDLPLRCPHCGSTQFYGGKRITGTGWLLIVCGILNLFVSIPLMAVLIGFLTVVLTPVLILIGFYACRRLVNTCARCKRDF